MGTTIKYSGKIWIFTHQPTTTEHGEPSKLCTGSIQRNINTRYLKGINIYPRATREIEKYTDNYYFSISNNKDTVEDFPSLAKNMVVDASHFYYRLQQATETSFGR